MGHLDIGFNDAYQITRHERELRVYSYDDVVEYAVEISIYLSLFTRNISFGDWRLS